MDRLAEDILDGLIAIANPDIRLTDLRKVAAIAAEIADRHYQPIVDAAVDALMRPARPMGVL